MSMDLGGAKGGVKSDINVTPLVDVMLVLLMIMMIITPMLNQGVAVILPSASNTVPKPDTQDQVTVAIGRDGAMYLQAHPVRAGELATKLNELFENKHEKIVFVRADEEAQYGKVMAAMDELRAAQIEDIALITANQASSAEGK
jgi:biopolymer transport protein TolR